MCVNFKMGNEHLRKALLSKKIKNAHVEEFMGKETFECSKNLIKNDIEKVITNRNLLINEIRTITWQINDE